VLALRLLQSSRSWALRQHFPHPQRVRIVSIQSLVSMNVRIAYSLFGDVDPLFELDRTHMLSPAFYA